MGNGARVYEVWYVLPDQLGKVLHRIPVEAIIAHLLCVLRTNKQDGAGNNEDDAGAHLYHPAGQQQPFGPESLESRSSHRDRWRKVVFRWFLFQNFQDGNERRILFKGRGRRLVSRGMRNNHGGGLYTTRWKDAIWANGQTCPSPPIYACKTQLVLLDLILLCLAGGSSTSCMRRSLTTKLAVFAPTTEGAGGPSFRQMDLPQQLLLFRAHSLLAKEKPANSAKD